jgi:hypothetical protein
LGQDDSAEFFFQITDHLLPVALGNKQENKLCRVKSTALTHRNVIMRTQCADERGSGTLPEMPRLPKIAEIGKA